MTFVATESVVDHTVPGEQISVAILELLMQRAAVGAQVEVNIDGIGTSSVHFFNGLVKREVLPLGVLQTTQELLLASAAVLNDIGLLVRTRTNAAGLAVEIIRADQESFDTLPAPVVRNARGVIESGLACYHTKGVKVTIRPEQEFASAEILREESDLIVRLDVKAAIAFLSSCDTAGEYEVATWVTLGGEKQSLVSRRQPA